mmetsp:Transcript_24355/g.96571  ORF Transcript_24355/g.96571 Transcript_24355/m.96571 type:complete len:334 (-) Transcript_24355:616-1617(-)
MYRMASRARRCGVAAPHHAACRLGRWRRFSSRCAPATKSWAPIPRRTISSAPRARPTTSVPPPRGRTRPSRVSPSSAPPNCSTTAKSRRSSSTLASTASSRGCGVAATARGTTSRRTSITSSPRWRSASTRARWLAPWAASTASSSATSSKPWLRAPRGSQVEVRGRSPPRKPRRRMRRWSPRFSGSNPASARSPRSMSTCAHTLCRAVSGRRCGRGSRTTAHSLSLRRATTPSTPSTRSLRASTPWATASRWHSPRPTPRSATVRHSSSTNRSARRCSKRNTASRRAPTAISTPRGTTSPPDSTASASTTARPTFESTVFAKAPSRRARAIT